MAITELARFCNEYLPQHSELKQKIEAIGDETQFATAIVEGGTRAGFDFTLDEVNHVMSSRSGTELSESQLEAVSGGRKAGGGQLEYLTIQMSDILITS